MDQRTGWGDALPDEPPTAAPATGLTADVMTRLEQGKPIEPRARITNTTTYVLLGLALLVGTFSAGAWVGRKNAPATTTTATAANPAAAFGGGATGASGRTRGSGATGFPGATGATGAPGGANGFPGATGATGAGGAGGAGGFAGAGGNATAGTVKLVDGTNVYIATTSGTVVKVTTTPQSQISITKQGGVTDLAVGETVIVQGETGADGTIAATSIRSGLGAGGAGGGRNGGTTPASGATGR